MSRRINSLIFYGTLGGLYCMAEKFNSEELINARWVVDSETGNQYLLDIKTSTVIAKKDKDGVWVNPDKEDL